MFFMLLAYIADTFICNWGGRIDLKPIRFSYFSGVSITAWKVSAFGVILIRAQSECGKIRTRITPNTDTFYAVQVRHKGRKSWTFLSFNYFCKTLYLRFLSGFWIHLCISNRKIFSFQKTSFKVNRKDLNIIMHLINIITDRVFEWNWKNI